MGSLLIVLSLIADGLTLVERISDGDLTTAEASVLTQILVVAGLILGFVFTQIGAWQKRREERDQRERDRKEREVEREQDRIEQAQRAKELAELVILRAEKVATQTQAIHEETLAHISAVQTSANLAFETANHSNEKIAKLAEHIDTTLQIVPTVAAAVADALKPAPVAPSIERTPGTVLTEMRPPVEEASDGERKEA